MSQLRWPLFFVNDNIDIWRSKKSILYEISIRVSRPLPLQVETNKQKFRRFLLELFIDRGPSPAGIYNSRSRRLKRKTNGHNGHGHGATASVFYDATRARPCPWKLLEDSRSLRSAHRSHCRGWVCRDAANDVGRGHARKPRRANPSITILLFHVRERTVCHWAGR